MKEPTMDDHDDFEARLTRALHAGADADGEVTPPGPADVHRRRDRHRRRRVVAGSAAAALLLAGAVTAGWAAGRDGDDGERVVGGPSTTADERGDPRDDGIVLGSGEIPTVVPDHRSSLGGGSSASDPGEPTDLPTAVLFTRTLDDGTTLEVRANAYDPSSLDLPPFWDPPGGCYPVGDLYVSARFPDAVGQLATGRYVDVAPGDLRGGIDVVALAEGAPRWLAVATVPADVASVVIRFPGGGEDSLTAVDGVVVLTAPVTPGLFDGPADVHEYSVQAGDTEVEMLDDAGAVVASWSAPWPYFSLGEVPVMGAGCTAPTALPDPGPWQPADPAAAEAAIRTSWEVMYGDPTGRTLEEQAAVVDDPRNLSEGLESIRSRYDAEQIATTTVAIEEIVFESAERAYVRYSVDAGPLGTFGDRFGELRLIGGTWKLTRHTVCSLLGLGGYRCPPVDG